MTKMPIDWCQKILGDAGTNSPAIQKMLDYPYCSDDYFPQLLHSIKRLSNWSEVSFDDLAKLSPSEAKALVLKFLDTMAIINRNSCLENILNHLDDFFVQNGIEIEFQEPWEFLPDDSRVLGVAFTNDEINELWKVANSFKIRNPKILRNRALFIILVSTGCRIKDLVEIKKKDLVPIDGFYRIEFRNHFPQFSSGVRFVGFLDSKAKTILDEFLNSEENLESDDFIFNLSISSIEQFLKKLCDRANIKLNVFGTNQNMKTNQRIRKRLFDILEKNNISKETIRYLQPPRETEYNRNDIPQEKIDQMFLEYKQVSQYVTGFKIDISVIVKK